MDPVDIFDSFDEVSKRDNYHLGRAGESQLEFCRGRRVAMRLMRLVVVAPSIIACLIRLYLVWKGTASHQRPDRETKAGQIPRILGISLANTDAT
jgi:hypothetical protein